MLPRLTKSSISPRVPHSVHICLQPMSPQSSAFVKSMLDESDDAPEWSYSTPTPPPRQRSASSSSSVLFSSNNVCSRTSLLDVMRLLTEVQLEQSSGGFSWRGLLCIPLLPLGFLRATSPSDIEPRVHTDIRTLFDPARSPTPEHYPDLSPIHDTLISSDKGKGKTAETSPLLEVTSPVNESRYRPPTWTSAIPISLVTD